MAIVTAPSTNCLSEELSCWDQDGVLVLRNFFDSARVNEVNEAIDTLWCDRKTLSSKIVIDTHLQSSRSFRQLLKYTSLESRQHPYKINDLYLEIPVIRNLILNELLCQYLSVLLDGSPMAFNTLNFEHGSQQNDHRDSLFMPPRVPNKLAVSWIALEDVTADNGPLRYYPGSHKIPPFKFSNGRQNDVKAELELFDTYMKEAINERAIKPVSFEAKAGDVLIWHSELLHGGEPIVNKGSSRKSLVTHYYRKKDYLHRFWQIKKHHSDGYFFKRPHQEVQI